MLSSAVRTFSNPDQYAAAIRATTVELTEVGSKQFNANLIRIDLHNLWMQRFWESAPRIKHSSVICGRAIISFLTKPGPEVISRGVPMRPTEIVRHSEGHDFYQRSSGSMSFGSMSLPLNEMARVAGITAGCDLMPPSDALVVTPSPAAMAKLLRLHAAAGCLAEDAPKLIANHQAAYGLEQALILAMVDCLGNGEIRPERSAQRRHDDIMRRFRKVIQEHPDEPLYVPEVCASIRVNERTLRICCHEQLGVGPKQYLLLRRMHLARGALRLADPSRTKVTEVATRYGFWELGRFAVEYKSLYGESPSATLSHAPG